MNTISFKQLATGLALFGAIAGTSQDSSAQNILVFDNSNHKSAELAANLLSPGNVTLATSANFETLIPSLPWDLILVSNPTTKPSSWAPLASFVTSGGRVAMSHWDFDLTSYPGMSALVTAFEVVNAGSISTSGQTLTDSLTTSIFSGIPTPIIDWHNHWGDDGDVFTPVGSAIGVAHFGNPAAPTMVLGNAGRTMVMPVFDELGDTYITPGLDIQIWQNVSNLLLGGGSGSCTSRAGVLGTNPKGYDCVFPPFAGSNWLATIDTVPVAGTATIGTIIAVRLSGGIDNIPLFGYEMLALPPYSLDVANGSHSIPIPAAISGFGLATQGVRLETDALGNVTIVLMNAQDVVIG